ncbi:MAG: HAD hydrolase-like protein [Proteobacteria bacterium]|nr:HAD hydrolase-like protein [Pseudomonadota bacterium]
MNAMPRPYDTYFFDFDGVLVESNAVKEDAFRTLYEPHGPDVLAKVMVHHGKNEGISRLIKIRHCHLEFLGIELDQAALTEIAGRYGELVEAKVTAAPWVEGAREFLDNVRQDKHCFVVSGTPEPELRRIVDARGMTGYFTEVRGSPMDKTEIVDELIGRHGIEAAGALFVGDAEADRIAAVNNGIAFIGRVAAGQLNPFPPGTATIPSLRELKD